MTFYFQCKHKIMYFCLSKKGVMTFQRRYWRDSLLGNWYFRHIILRILISKHKKYFLPALLYKYYMAVTKYVEKNTNSYLTKHIYCLDVSIEIVHTLNFNQSHWYFFEISKGCVACMMNDESPSHNASICNFLSWKFVTF